MAPGSRSDSQSPDTASRFPEAVTGRPYEHHSEAELLHLKTTFERQLREVGEERQHQLSNVYWNTEHESVRNFDFKLDNIRRSIREIDDELAARRATRAAGG